MIFCGVEFVRPRGNIAEYKLVSATEAVIEFGVLCECRSRMNGSKSPVRDDLLGGHDVKKSDPLCPREVSFLSSNGVRCSCKCAAAKTSIECCQH